MSIIENLQREDVSPSRKRPCTARCSPSATRSAAGGQDQQGQGIRREPAAPDRCAAGGPRAGGRGKDTISHAYELMKMR